MTLPPLLALERLLVALLVGALIGLDRERAEARKPHHVFAGVRTFPLIALVGTIPMLVIDLTGPALLQDRNTSGSVADMSPPHFPPSLMSMP